MFGRGRARGVATAVLVFIALAVAASRVLLGVHYLSDVVAGLALGTGIAAATVALTLMLDRRPSEPVKGGSTGC